MNITLGKSPFLRSSTEEPDDLLVVSNSFDQRCIYAVSTIPQSGYLCKQAIVINYDSTTQEHKKIKLHHWEIMEGYIKDALRMTSVPPKLIPTYKYDVISFYRDVSEQLEEIQNCRNITVDISTFTKCTLMAFLSILRNKYPKSHIRCVWTPGIYGPTLDLTRGVKDTFAVPGFGGIGWQRCRVLVLFLGQERDRSFSLWRAVDPDFVYLISGESIYSMIDHEKVFRSVRDITALVESNKFVVSAVDPRENFEILNIIYGDLKKKKYTGEVAVACLGTKLQLIGIWLFWQVQSANKKGWSFIYSSPKEFMNVKSTQNYYREINEVDLTP